MMPTETPCSAAASAARCPARPAPITSTSWSGTKPILYRSDSGVRRRYFFLHFLATTADRFLAFLHFFLGAGVWAGVVGVCTAPPLCSKLAVTFLVAEFMLTVHWLPVTESQPCHRANRQPAEGVAVRTTEVPDAKVEVHVAPQLMAAGTLVTVPDPAPDLLTKRSLVVLMSRPQPP